MYFELRDLILGVCTIYCLKIPTFRCCLSFTFKSARTVSYRCLKWYRGRNQECATAFGQSQLRKTGREAGMVRSQ